MVGVEKESMAGRRENSCFILSCNAMYQKENARNTIFVLFVFFFNHSSLLSRYDPAIHIVIIYRMASSDYFKY